jgi:hypothetical protein
MLKKWKWTQNKVLLTTMLDRPFHTTLIQKMLAIFDRNMKKLKFWSLAYLPLVGKGIIINSIFFASQWFF